MKPLSTWLLTLACLPCLAAAQDLQFHGYADVRVQHSFGDEISWVGGGLGKSRFGADSDGALQFGGAALAARWQVTAELIAVADVQLHSQTSPRLGLLDAYLRYRPVSTTPWRWSLRAGAFFPPISLENDDVGWTSHWTLTPSAINSWVGEELRTLGAELRVEHRGTRGTLEFGVAMFRRNDPAGELLASRGWALGDVTSNINSRLRQPDVYSSLARSPAPLRYTPFAENDGRIGWHADVAWHAPGGAVLSLLGYDNRADPESFGAQSFGAQRGRHVYSWRTRFLAVGAEMPVGELVLIGQLMSGSTAFEPLPDLYLESEFQAGYLLAGWNRGDWQPAVRLDVFSLRQLPAFLPDPLSEHGHAWTAALNWRPAPWLRVTGELLRIDSTRNQRRVEGLSPRQVDMQLQLSLRLLF